MSGRGKEMASTRGKKTSANTPPVDTGTADVDLTQLAAELVMLSGEYHQIAKYHTQLSELVDKQKWLHSRLATVVEQTSWRQAVLGQTIRSLVGRAEE